MAANRRTSQRVTLLMLVLVSLTVLTLDYHGEASRAIGHVRNGIAQVFQPIQRGVAAALHPVGDLVSGMVHYSSLQGENARLRAELGSLSQQVSENDALAAQARQLYSLEGLPFVQNIPTVGAQVISKSTSNFELTAEINRGTASGVGVGMPVVSQKGLIGKVLSASANTATVQLISDARSTVGVRVGANGVFAAAGAGAATPLNLQQIAPSGVPRRGELALTAGDLTYPADIPVGVVSSVQTSAGGIFAAASLRPLVNLRDLDFVSVLQWLTPA